jgi:type IV pilus assembly protein PilC
MAQFRYKAMDFSGNIVSDIIEAESQGEVVSILKTRGLIVVEVKEKNSFFSMDLSFSSSLRKRGDKGKVKGQELAIFCRQLATLVNAGVNILDALEDVAGMGQNAYFSNVLLKVCEEVKGGKDLSASLLAYPKIFNNAFVSMIRVGEKSGQLARVLKDLAEYTESAVKLRAKIKSAASYPIFVGSFFVIVFFGIVFILIPKFEDMFASFGADLPGPTKLVMGISHFCVDKAPILILFLAIVFVVFKIVTKNPEGKRKWHNFFFKIPIFGPIYTKIIFSRFFKTLSTLVQSGVDLITSIEIATTTIGNTYVTGILDEIRNTIIAGEQFSDSMDRYQLFPKMIVRMTAVGEKSGQLQDMFIKITDYYTDEVDATVASLSSVVEPILIIFLGFVVGTAVIALYLPIFNMANAMMGGM